MSYIVTGCMGRDSRRRDGARGISDLSRPLALQAGRIDPKRMGREGRCQPGRVVRHAKTREPFAPDAGEAARRCKFIACRV